MLHSLDDSSNAHATANAERNQVRGQVAPLQLIQHGAEQHRAGGADWLAEGDHPAIHVRLPVMASACPRLAELLIVYTLVLI